VSITLLSSLHLQVLNKMATGWATSTNLWLSDTSSISDAEDVEDTGGWNSSPIATSAAGEDLYWESASQADLNWEASAQEDVEDTGGWSSSPMSGQDLNVGSSSQASYDWEASAQPNFSWRSPPERVEEHVSGWGIFPGHYHSIAMAAVIWRDGLKPLRLARLRHAARLADGLDRINLASLPYEVMEVLEDCTAEAVYQYSYGRPPFLPDTLCPSYWHGISLYEPWGKALTKHMENVGVEHYCCHECAARAFRKTYEGARLNFSYLKTARAQCQGDCCSQQADFWDAVRKRESHLAYSRSVSKKTGTNAMNVSRSLYEWVCRPDSPISCSVEALSQAISRLLLDFGFELCTGM
jgi:hypothetical protein